MNAANFMTDEDEKRLVAVTAIGLEAKALVLDEATREVTWADNAAAERLFYARAFQAWADGKIEGTAEQVFETVEEALNV
jgi:hypothetical protein